MSRVRWLRVAAFSLVASAALRSISAGQRADALARARTLYNQSQYDAAIGAASEARSTPATANAATLVLARAYLERFRQSGDTADLAFARTALVAVDATLSDGERVEFVVGLGEALFLEDAFGASAEIFETVIDRLAPAAGAEPRERTLDWWATALDRQAQHAAGPAREAAYARILGYMETRLRQDPASAAATYWVAAASRATGDLERAWNLAVAGWVRGALSRENGAALRADLDRLVVQAIIPERARQVTGASREDAQAAMLAEWEIMKGKWSTR